MSLDEITAQVAGAVALIMLLSALLAALTRRLGQPEVIAQILTGVLLGPTVLGPEVTERLFPRAILPYLSVLAQVAITLFMFVVGYEIDLRLMRRRRFAVSLVASGALLVPMAVGMGSALLFAAAFQAAGEPHVHSRSFVLFTAVAVSLTALPVLAAILRERDLAATVPGVIATGAAGVMDVVAWVVLAAAVAGGGRPAWQTVLLLGCLIAVLAAARPVLGWWLRRPDSLMRSELPIAIVLVMGCAWATASLGVHAVFGGFLAGLMMPRRDGAPDMDALRSMESAAKVLLPLFFVVTGLSLDIGALRPGDLALFGLILLIAVGAKAGPAYAAARMARLERRDAGTVAVLLNTRGLTELIALNVGLSSGIIHQRLFAMLVLMALVTTAMTGPLLAVLARGARRDEAVLECSDRAA